jgi:hypothetical protein
LCALLYIQTQVTLASTRKSKPQRSVWSVNIPYYNVHMSVGTSCIIITKDDKLNRRQNSHAIKYCYVHSLVLLLTAWSFGVTL